MSTTTPCPKCSGSGVIHNDLGSGMMMIGQCDCQPPEHWEQASKDRLERVKAKLEEAKLWW